MSPLPSRRTRSARKARPTFRPRLEALEDRYAPAAYSWTGGGDGTSWQDTNNWTQPNPAQPSYPGSQGASDSANIPAGTNANINCTVSVLGGLAQGSSSVTITLQNTLTISGGQSTDSGTSQFNWAGGSLIPAASGDNLVLNDINPNAGGDHNSSYWTGGTFGDDIHQMTLVLLGASQLNVGTVTMNGAIQVGESSGPTTANLLTLSDGATLTLGTASTVSHTITVNGYGSTLSEWDYAGAGTVAGANVDAGDEFLAAGGTAKFENNGTTNKTVEQDMPLEVTKSTGTVIVQSHVNAFIKGSTVATKPYAIDIGSDGLKAQLRLGVMNPGDTSDGNAQITTLGAGAMGGAGKADVRVGGSAIFEADGENNYLFMRSTADATMTVNGTLYLGNTNGYASFEKSSLSIGATALPNKNNLTFGDNGTFSFSVKFPTGGVGKDQDKLAANGTITIAPTAKYAVQPFGPLATTTFDPVIQTLAGPRYPIVGNFTNSANWQAQKATDLQSIAFKFTAP